ncbi:hypothetical protein PROFUN_01225 [Planoprotostelium fungivorum]|uniref:Glucose-methanol-choline oxidoreductase N-terminal domain-containing protein n=1 Tax=Planoprotostelium fungivorum TaxID=1890364 RepID=A0A2P6NZJ0_9EUKA|nr:hypothetical protein PROFUN_01225 [Planoprotostelium fungivorum]
MSRGVLIFFLLVTVCHGALQTTYSTYDYVVVGGGGAGSLWAARLSENLNRTVLVLEQGPNATCYKCDNTANMNDIDDLWTSHGNSQFTTPQGPVSRSFDQIKMSWPGGNTRIYQGLSYPAHPKVYNRYPSGLNYQTFLPYYRKFQDHYCNYLNSSYTGISPANCTKYHGARGPMGISPPFKNLSDSLFFKDMTSDAGLNFTYLPDAWNADDQLSSPNHIFYQQLFRQVSNPSDPNSPRVRQSTYNGYTPPRVLSRKNLTYKTETQVIRIIFRSEVERGSFPGLSLSGFPSTNNSATQAVGVIYQTEEDSFAVFAKRQLVLSGGVLGTPKLLQISGVGPADLLRSLNITVVADNRFIGQNVAEHPAFAAVYKTKLQLSYTLENFGRECNMNGEKLTFKVIGTAQLTSPFARNGYPDIQIQLFPTFPINNLEGVTGTSPLQLQYPPSPYPGDPSALGGAPILNLIILRTDPTTRGSVNITGTRYRYNSRLDLGFPNDFTAYASSEDYQAQSWAVNYLRGKLLNNATAFAKKWIQSELVPGPAPVGTPQSQYDLQSNAYGFDLSYHQTGGVNLGTATDNLGSVNGVSGITVCDNSLQPVPPNLNPTASMLALYEIIFRVLIQQSLSSITKEHPSVVFSAGSVGSHRFASKRKNPREGMSGVNPQKTKKATEKETLDKPRHQRNACVAAVVRMCYEPKRYRGPATAACFSIASNRSSYIVISVDASLVSVFKFLIIVFFLTVDHSVRPTNFRGRASSSAFGMVTPGYFRLNVLYQTSITYASKWMKISLDNVTSLKDTEEEDHPHDTIGARHHGHDLSLVAVAQLMFNAFISHDLCSLPSALMEKTFHVCPVRSFGTTNSIVDCWYPSSLTLAPLVAQVPSPLNQYT